MARRKRGPAKGSRKAKAAGRKGGRKRSRR